MRDETDRAFQRLESGDGEFNVPDLDLRETTNTLVAEAELSGVDEKDVSVAPANGVLTIKGERKQ